MIPSATLQAYERLVSEGRIDVRVPLNPDGLPGDGVFVFRVHPPQPNRVGLPPDVDVRARIPALFPLTNVELAPINPCLRGFAHQDGLTGALCLGPETSFPPDADQRLRAYVEKTHEWFEDAANERLLPAGRPWELPDFRIARKDRPPLIYVRESERSFHHWCGRLGQTGVVHFVEYVHGGALLAVRFEGRDGPPLDAVIAEGFVNRKRTALGTWLLLPSHIVYRHRAAMSFRELEVVCSCAGINLWAVLRRALDTPPANGFHHVLVGAPIPRNVGEPAVEVHWQPIQVPHGAVQQIRHSRARTTTPGVGIFRTRIRGALIDQALPWGHAHNASEGRLTSRGSLDDAIKGMNIALLGCGAIGSAVADHLARGGLRNLTLFDNQILDLENVPRHTLAGPEVGHSKAIALARRLTGIHPDAHIRGYSVTLPLEERPAKARRAARAAFDAADVYIDCTAETGIGRWASSHARSTGRLAVQIYINANARMLTICASGLDTSCERVEECLHDDIHNRRTPLRWIDYTAEGEEIRVGAGCWSETFPGRGSHIAALVAAAMPVLESLITRPRSSHGTAVVLRRNDLPRNKNGSIGLTPNFCLVKIAWSGDYQ